ncbi:hypothetical protein GF325_17525 [Candidatus Bathyarchaeota archaeon]|nr:hypothetical protein [Candidatus Bathyarchaeota archaeon]
MADGEEKGKWFKLDFLPVYIFIIGEIALFLMFIISPIDYTYLPYLKENPDMVQAVLLAIGIGMLVFAYFKFLSKYISSPNETRLTVLLSLICFLGAFILKLYMNFSRYVDSQLNRYFFNMVVLLLMVTLYLFNLFGISILITPENQVNVTRWKKSLIIFLTTTYVIFFGKTALRIYDNSLTFDIVENITNVAMYAYMGYNVVILITMSFKSATLAMRAHDPVVQSGLRFLAISLMLLVGGVVILLISELLAFIVILETITVFLGVVSFVFIYFGFVRPSVSKNG